MSDPWKRDRVLDTIGNASDDAADVMSGYNRYPEQLSIELNKPRDATPEEFEAWRKQDYWSRGEYNPLFMMVVIPTLIQISMLFLMFTIILLNDYLF
tara:strand:+ start:592 stop:882 length:291 start_codon:yes stop_codon:yes gene_type:complete